MDLLKKTGLVRLKQTSGVIALWLYFYGISVNAATQTFVCPKPPFDLAFLVNWCHYEAVTSQFVFFLKCESRGSTEKIYSTVYWYLWVNRPQWDKLPRAMTWQDLAELCDLNSKPFICVPLLNISVIVIFPPVLFYGPPFFLLFITFTFCLFDYLFLSSFSPLSFACPSYFTVAQWLKGASVLDPSVCNERLKTDCSKSDLYLSCLELNGCRESLWIHDMKEIVGNHSS